MTHVLILHLQAQLISAGQAAGRASVQLAHPDLG